MKLRLFTLLLLTPLLASAAPTGEPLKIPTGSDGFGHAGILLAGMLLFVAIGIYLLKFGFSFGPRGTGERRLQIRESRMLGNRQFVVVVEYDRTRMLLGVTPGKIDYLCALPDEGEAIPVAAPRPVAAPPPVDVPAPAPAPAPVPVPPSPKPPRFVLPLLALLLSAVGALAQDAPLSLPPARLTVPTPPPMATPPPSFSLGGNPFAAPPTGFLPSSSQPLVNLQLGNGDERQNVSSAIQILVVMTMLTLAPSLMMLVTSFTRIVIVLGFVRTALGVQGAPANQIIVGISIFLTFFIMAPVGNRVNDEALQPYLSGQLNSRDALERGSAPLREFMLKQTRPADTEFFLRLNNKGPTKVEEVPMSVAVPAFVISELRTAFQMGFLIFIPFLVVDFLVSSTLMSMGMMMMPPVVVSLPFKLLLFVLADGWQLVIRSLVQSFN